MLVTVSVIVPQGGLLPVLRPGGAGEEGEESGDRGPLPLWHPSQMNKWFSAGPGERNLSLAVASRPQGSCPVPRSGVPGWVAKAGRLGGGWAADRARRPAAALEWSREPNQALTHSVPLGTAALPGPFLSTASCAL